MKGITPVIAIIILLLITVALAGATWNYLFMYWEGVVGKQIELTDTFCIQGSQAVILIRNTGTKEFNPAAEITVINATSGSKFNVWSGLPPMINWSNADGTNLTGNLGPNRIARFNALCPVGNLCTFRIIAGSAGRTIRASVQC